LGGLGVTTQKPVQFLFWCGGVWCGLVMSLLGSSMYNGGGSFLHPFGTSHKKKTTNDTTKRNPKGSLCFSKTWGRGEIKKPQKSRAAPWLRVSINKNSWGDGWGLGWEVGREGALGGTKKFLGCFSFLEGRARPGGFLGVQTQQW